MARPIHRRRLLAGFGLAGAAGFGLAACTRTQETPPKADGPSVAITSPGPDAQGVPAAAEITYALRDAVGARVELRSAAGELIPGEDRPDLSSWVPAKTLAYATAYTVTITAGGTDGKPVSARHTFTTMAKPAKTIRLSSFLGDGARPGVAMPLMFTFSRSVPAAKRAAVEKRLTVTASPAQEGAWHWQSGTQLHYRPKEFWRPGTQIGVRAAVGGLDLGNGYYGSADVRLDDVTIGPAVVLVADNATKTMTVTRDGRLLRTMPISLGKPSTPSSSGTTVIIEKLAHTIFDTFAELGPENGYRTPIDWAQRLTWGGEFIHSAPWSVEQQGSRNVSHGCINVSPENAEWLFGITSVGDPVITKGTERKLRDGNGWTDWNLSWSAYSG
ncbi:L,D-transpeptidase [Hamadaea tsunoensis]|uniref:L,D-transpeptidase n=1 Tax=Hamadaea tsunoensis TaxID=53368 RepID=UPI0004152971|nr:Ig-like domain-containing protein [Hamadaea tsunoensis]